MSHLLVLYDIAQKASAVTSKKALYAYKKWISKTIKTYHDAAIEHVAHIHLFRLKEQYGL